MNSERDIGRDDELERLRAGLAALAEEARPRADCPDQEELWSAAQGELSPTRLSPLLAHLAVCGVCRESWQLACQLWPGAPLAAQIDVATSAALEPVAESGISRQRRWRWLAPLAAAAVFVLVLVAPWPSDPPAELRLGGQQQVQSLVSQPLPRHSFLLRWTGPPGARYQLRVSDDELKIRLTVADLAAAEYQVPADLLHDLASGDRLLWQVTADLANGRRILSPTFPVELE